MQLTTTNIPLLGLILKHEGALLESQIDWILWHQQQAREEGRVKSFGEIALELNLTSAFEIRKALRVQAKLKAAPKKPKPQAYYALVYRLVKPSQLLYAMNVQEATGDDLGAIMHRLGWIDSPRLEHVLFQEDCQSMAA